MPRTTADYHGISSGTLWTRVIRELKMQRHPLKLNAFTIPLNMELCLWANSKFKISFPATVFFFFFSYIFHLPLASFTLLENLFEAVNNVPRNFHGNCYTQHNYIALITKNTITIFHKHHDDIFSRLMKAAVGRFHCKRKKWEKKKYYKLSQRYKIKY